MTRSTCPACFHPSFPTSRVSTSSTFSGVACIHPSGDCFRSHSPPGFREIRNACRRNAITRSAEG